MAYVRLSVVRPRPGREDEALRILHSLSAATEGSPGWVAGYVLKPDDDSGELARISIYEQESDAEREAASDKVLALRSELHMVIEPGHRERGLFTI